MKHPLYLLLILFAGLSIRAIAQNSDPVSLIILNNGDSLFNKEILKDVKYTNSDFITYRDNGGNSVKLSATEIKACFFKEKLYYSENIKDENKKLLITYIVGGPVSLGCSYSPGGKRELYLKKGDEVVQLSKYRENPEAFLQTFLEDYASFKIIYSAAVTYNVQSLANMTAAYNSFLFPDQYIFQKYKDEEPLSVRAFASGGLAFSSLSGERMIGPSVAVGADFCLYYPGSVSVHLPFSFYYAHSEASDALARFFSMSFEPYLTSTLDPNGDNRFEIGAGLGILYNMESEVEGDALLADQTSNVDIHRLLPGANFTLLYHINQQLCTQFKTSCFKFRTGSLKPGSPGDTSGKGVLIDAGLTISYYF